MGKIVKYVALILIISLITTFGVLSLQQLIRPSIATATQVLTESGYLVLDQISASTLLGNASATKAKTDNLPDVAVDSIYLDQGGGTGVAGTDFPIGTPSHPVNNLADALQIMSIRKLTTLHLINSGSITFSQSATLNIVGSPTYDVTITGGTLTVLSDFRCGNLTVQDPGKIIVIGNTMISVVMTHSTNQISVFQGDLMTLNAFSNVNAGTIYINGTWRGWTSVITNGLGLISIEGDYYGFASNGIVNVQGVIGISGNCYLSDGDISNDRGTIIIHGNCMISHLGNLSNSQGTVEVDGDCSIHQGLTSTTTGGFTVVGGHFTGYDVNVGAGSTMITPNLPATIAHTITNAGTLTYKGVHPEVAISANAVVAPGTTIINLSTANTHYTVDKLRLKCADPGVDTVTVQLWELVNSILTLVDSFDITNANFGTYFSLRDMFNVDYLSGDGLKVVVVASANTYAVTGSYSYRSE